MIKETKLIISGETRKLDTALARSERRIATFGRKTISTFRRVGATIDTVSTRYLTRFNAILGGAAMVMAGKKVIDFDARLARLKIQANLSMKEFLGLKKTLFDIADLPGMPGAEELLGGIESIVERTGDFKFAVKSLKDMGMVSGATGAAMEDLGATAANLADKAGITSSEVLVLFDILAAQGKEGAFTLQYMARMMERLLAASGRLNVKGVQGMRIFGAWLQVAKKGTGSPEQATTAIEAAIREMLDPQRVAKMKRLAGFNPIDVEASKKAGVTVMKDLESIIKGVIAGTKGDEMKLGQIFGQESIRAMTRIAQVYRETGTFNELDKFIQKGGDGKMIMEDFAFWSEQSAARIKNFYTQLSRFANQNLAKPIEAFTKALSFLNKHPVIASGGIWTLIGLGGGLGIYRIISGVTGMFRGIGGVLKGAGAVPVRVVNGGFTSGIPGMGGRMGRMGIGRYALRFLPHALPFLAYKGFEKYAQNKFGTDISFWQGAKDFWGEKFVNWFGSEQQKQDWQADYLRDIKNNINLTVNIDKDGRVKSVSDDMNTAVDAGVFF